MQYDFAAICRLLEAVWQQAYSDAAQGLLAAEYFLDATTGAEWRRRPLPPPRRRRVPQKVRQRDEVGQ